MEQYIIRYLSWKNVFENNRDLFSDWLNCKNKNLEPIMFYSHLHNFFSNYLTDNEIISDILDSNRTLFTAENDISQLKNLFVNMKKILSKDLIDTNRNYLVSIDKLYPIEFKKVLEDNLNSKRVQFIPIILEYSGDIDLLSNSDKRAIIGTRNPKDEMETNNQINLIYKKYPESICVSGLASGVDSMAINIFASSISFIAESLQEFINRKQRDSTRLQAKNKSLDSGLILSHILNNDKMNAILSRSALLERNLFVVLIASTVHPMEYSIKSGTISAISHAIKNNKKIFTPKKLVDNQVITKYSKSINFY